MVFAFVKTNSLHYFNSFLYNHVEVKNYITHDSAENNLNQSENLNQQAEPKEPPTVLWILYAVVNIWSGSKSSSNVS